MPAPDYLAWFVVVVATLAIPLSLIYLGYRLGRRR